MKLAFDLTGLKSGSKFMRTMQNCEKQGEIHEPFGSHAEQARPCHRTLAKGDGTLAAFWADLGTSLLHMTNIDKEIQSI